MKVKTTGSKLPHAWVVVPKDKGRRKIYNDNKIYLQNGEEFAIELHNPTQTNVVALINLDGKPISSSGLVVRAGERMYLDCFVDDLKKFIFDTYNVESNVESNDAIATNGLLEVFFYNELVVNRIDIPNIPRVQEHHHHHYPSRWYPYYQQDVWCGNTTTIGNQQIGQTNLYNTFTSSANSNTFNRNTDSTVFGALVSNTSSGVSINGDLNMTLTGSLDVSALNVALGTDMNMNTQNIGSTETGQTIKGEDSLLKFKEIDMILEEEHVSTISYTLLPESRMPLSSKDVTKASMELISDRLAEGESLNDLTNRIYTFNDMMGQKYIEEDEFELIRVKAVKSIIELSSTTEVSVDDLANHIHSFGDMMQQDLISKEEFKLIKTNLFNSIK